MADDMSRWERVNEKPAEKPVFSARQSTESFRQDAAPSARRSSRRQSRERPGKTWYFLAVAALALLAILLAWQVFAA